MNLNANSRFSQVPQVNAVRSKFEIPTSVKTSANVGQLVPFYYEEVLPGDTFSIDTSMIARMQPLVTPMYDDLFVEMFYFFIPNRLVWKHWKEFMGENTESAWYPTTEYNVPHVSFDAEHPPTFGSLADYFGYPIGDDVSYTASQLPFRAYGLCYNEFFRDENIQDPILIDTGDADVTFDGQTTYGGTVLNACKLHDYFTSALPTSQKGPDVYLPLNALAPVNAEASVHDITDFSIHNAVSHENNAYLIDGGNASNNYVFSFTPTGGLPAGTSTSFRPDNLWADLSQASATSINSLRQAIATQQFYEQAARGGTRYRELIKSMFNVTSPDGVQQVPELLNYNRIDVNVNQVVQQSQSTESSPLGTQGAFALSADNDNSFTKSFTEHGMVLGLMVARYKHSYQQGLNRRFSRRTMFDYYFPVFANLGEQPIYNKEIFVGGDDSTNNEVFGYQEAFADYRYHPDFVTGEMRSNHPNTLDVWHLADYYETTPALSPEWIEEDKSNVDRVLSVTSDVSNQYWCDIYIQNTAVRTMPMYSIPGLPRI